MSLTDPTVTTSSRKAVCGVLGVLVLVAAGYFGWGLSVTGMEHPTGARITGFAAGIGATLVCLAVLVILLPSAWRVGSAGVTTGLLLGGVALLAASAGAVVGGATLPAVHVGWQRPWIVDVVAAGLFVIGLALLGGAQVVRARQHSSDALQRDLAERGVEAQGVVLSSLMTGEVNNVPRWKFVVKYADATGTTRYVTKHVTGFDGPSVGSAVSLRYDPTNPGDQKRILVS